MAELKANTTNSSSQPQQIEAYPGNNVFLEFEDAYLDLLRAYTSCLISLKLYLYNYDPNMRLRHTLFSTPTPNILIGNLLAPRILRWRLARHVQMVRECFLMLVAFNRSIVAPEILCRFEQYCMDMEKISSQVEKYGFIALFYGTIPVLILGTIVSQITAIFSIKDVFNKFIFLLVIGYISIYILMFLFIGYYGSKRVFDDAEIQDKEDKLFILIGKNIDIQIRRTRPWRWRERAEIGLKKYWKLYLICIIIYLYLNFYL